MGARALTVLLVLWFPHVPSVHAATDAAFDACQTDPVCRAAYHQTPANRAVFDAVYALGTDAPDAATAALRSRAVGLRLCARNEQYTVDADGHARCTCPDDGRACGPVTPFRNDIVYVACLASTLAIWYHVLHHVHRSNKVGVA